jgi:hypothetical protein
VSEFLQDYGEGDAKRSRRWKIAAAAAVLIAVVGGGLYFYFRDYREERQVAQFVVNLQSGNYDAAYAQWGCTREVECRDYAFEKFMEDWGPGSPAAQPNMIKIGRKRSCDGGIIQTLELQPGDEVLLYVDRYEKTLGFSPWPTCNPSMKINAG